MEKIEVREQYLLEGAALIIPEIIEPQLQALNLQLPRPDYRISVAPIRARRLSECHPRANSADGTNEIIISARYADSKAFLLALLVSLIEAYTDCQGRKRGGLFAQIARRCGIQGPLLKADKATADLDNQLQEYVDLLGTIPHAELKVPYKSKGRNNNVIHCPRCGFKANTSAKWIDAIERNIAAGNAPICPACSTPGLYRRLSRT